MQGTPYWMAPEVIKGDPYSERADMWYDSLVSLSLFVQVIADAKL